MKFLSVHLHTCTHSKPTCATAKWGVSPTRRAAISSLVILLGSLPPLGRVFTHYSESALPLIFFRCENLMTIQLKEHLR